MQKHMLDILSCIQNKYSLICRYKYANFSHEIYVDLKKNEKSVDVAT